CRFVDVGPIQAEAIDRAVQAAAGHQVHVMRDWSELTAEANASPSANIVLGTTPAGHDIIVVARDMLEMGEDGTELYVELVAQPERLYSRLLASRARPRAYSARSFFRFAARSSALNGTPSSARSLPALSRRKTASL